MAIDSSVNGAGLVGFGMICFMHDMDVVVIVKSPLRTACSLSMSRFPTASTLSSCAPKSMHNDSVRHRGLEYPVESGVPFALS
jgi:hypothetical protein